MPYDINETHAPDLVSWVESANDPATDFPIQNLPLGIRGPMDDEIAGVVCTVVGDCVIDLWELEAAGLLDLGRDEPHDPQKDGIFLWTMDAFFHLQNVKAAPLRASLSRLLRADNPVLRDNRDLRGRAIRPLADIRSFERPIEDIGDYTDFYASIHHATNVGCMFRPDNPLLPNYKHVPIGYHGRASSIVPSGTPVRRPAGQLPPVEDHGSAGRATPGFGPCRMLDYEMELGVVISRGNELGEPIPVARAAEHIFGMCIVNDWSARDIQRWEYQPLGPFLSKSFATTVSPFVVTMEALAPFRVPAFERPPGDPRPLPYLDDETDRARGGLDITCEVFLASADMRRRGLSPVRLSRGSFRHMYWTIAQMVAHHTVNGCNLQPGDLLASGTVSGPERGNRGCLLELTWDGDPWANPPRIVPGSQRTPIELPTGEKRTFLQDGDEVVMRAFCERDGFRRIGFGECRGIVEPARG